ncbi:alcohol dehydrogenase [Caballeronia temeraria]|uniref:alcohol dehydrogenase n=2 Tax=Caballeronia temeraria TaxID=1777137 RepID=A0A158DIW7_9BURK|nr:alcohol dehydrogenase [Caballeronia temeraria]
MKLWAVVTNGEPLQALNEPDPTPQGAEVLVDVSHCGVCHSDVYFWKGEYNLGHGKVLRLTDRGVKLPRAPGHEVVGRVVAFGPEATGVKVGDRRIVYPWIGCGVCDRCKAGEDNMCAKQASIGVVRNGGFSSRVLVPHSRYLVDPGEIDPAVAATYACSGITVLNAIRKLGTMDPTSPVLLIGAGGLGLAAIAMLTSLGHQNIIAVDVDEAKRRAAIDTGATTVLDGNADDLQAQIAKAAGGTLLYALDFVNCSPTAKVAFESLGKGGKLVLVGATGGELEISLLSMILVPRTITGSQTGTLQDLKDVVAMARSGKLKSIPIDHMPFDKANEALVKLNEGKVTGRVVLERPEVG